MSESVELKPEIIECLRRVACEGDLEDIMVIGVTPTSYKFSSSVTDKQEIVDALLEIRSMVMQEMNDAD